MPHRTLVLGNFLTRKWPQKDHPIHIARRAYCSSHHKSKIASSDVSARAKGPDTVSAMDPRFVSSLKTEFPTAIELHTYLDEVSRILNVHGFYRHNTICAVSTCRDENCRPLINAVEDRWGAGFSLTAMVCFIHSFIIMDGSG